MDFIARSVAFFGSALERQVAEAVRIQRRGGEAAVLNSKAEFNRCSIPRLVVEKVEEESMSKMVEEERKKTEDDLLATQLAWESDKLATRKEERTKIAKKHTEKESKSEKRRVYSLIEEDWGEERPVKTSNINKKRKIEAHPESGREVREVAPVGKMLGEELEVRCEERQRVETHTRRHTHFDQ